MKERERENESENEHARERERKREKERKRERERENRPKMGTRTGRNADTRRRKCARGQAETVRRNTAQKGKNKKQQ